MSGSNEPPVARASLAFDATGGPSERLAVVPTFDDFLRLYRVRDWLHFVPLPLAGWISGDTRSPTTLVGGVVGWTLTLACMFAVNQAFDDRLDRALPGKNPVGTAFRRKDAVLLSLPPGLASLAVVAWLSPSGVAPAIVALVGGAIYSAPPRLKRLPLIGTVWNVLVGSMGLLFADAADAGRLPLRLLVGLFALLLLASQLLHEAEDRDDDRVGGVATLAVIAGGRGALTAAACCVLALPYATWWLADGLPRRGLVSGGAAAFALVVLPMLVLRVRRGDHTSGLRSLRLAYRYSALAFGCLVFAMTKL